MYVCVCVCVGMCVCVCVGMCVCVCVPGLVWSGTQSNPPHAAAAGVC